VTHSFQAKREHAVALRKIREWLASPEPQVFRLFGLAGTARRRWRAKLADMVPGKVAFVAFAGKAAMALRAHGCLSATTIHSLIYNVVPDVRCILSSSARSRHRNARSSSSMNVPRSNADVARDLLSYQIPVLALSDPSSRTSSLRTRLPTFHPI
jgi:hypothetical protein